MNSIKNNPRFTTRLVTSPDSDGFFNKLTPKIKTPDSNINASLNEGNSRTNDIFAKSSMQEIFKALSTNIDSGSKNEADKISDAALALQQSYADANIDLKTIGREALLNQIDKQLIDDLNPDQQNLALKASGFMG